MMKLLSLCGVKKAWSADTRVLRSVSTACCRLVYCSGCVPLFRRVSFDTLCGAAWESWL